MTRNWLKVLAALAFLGTMGLATTVPAQAQGFYVEGPGFGVGIGYPWYRHHYYYAPYRHYWHHRYYDWYDDR